MCKYFLSICLALCVLFYNNVQAAQFVEGMDDVPLMDGLSQITQDDISFGNEETRLLEAYVSAKNVKYSQITAYYKDSLPQLGWIYQGSRGKDLLFYREGETLEIAQEGKSPILIRITIKTKP